MWPFDGWFENPFDLTDEIDSIMSKIVIIIIFLVLAAIGILIMRGWIKAPGGIYGQFIIGGIVVGGALGFLFYMGVI